MSFEKIIMKIILVLLIILPTLGFSEDGFFILKNTPGHLNGKFIVYAETNPKGVATFDTSLSRHISFEEPNYIIESNDNKENAIYYDVIMVSNKGTEGIYYNFINVKNPKRSLAAVQFVNPHVVIISIDQAGTNNRKKLYMITDSTYESWTCKFGKEQTIEILRSRFLKDI